SAFSLAQSVNSIHYFQQSVNSIHYFQHSQLIVFTTSSTQSQSVNSIHYFR
ncbi:hypothetical protein L9F63_017455, partial [Diploptera punctata]